MTTHNTSDDRSNNDLTGQTLGDYQLLRRLGRGGMADVYLAQQLSLKRQIALKVLKSDLAKDDAYVRRFHHEAQAAAALVHANIVQIFEVGNIDGTHFIAQEYVRGQNLKQFVSRNGGIDPILAVNIIRQVGGALQKASQLAVVHRDIKPENIMLASTGEVKVADFGLARIIDSQQQNDLTQIGITLGTPLYMSPEQVEGSAVDTRSDIYSLGITCYHMLAGRPPYEGDTALAIAVQHVKKKATSLTEIRPDLPVELCGLIEKMMAKRPEDRFENANQMLKELRHVPLDFDGDWDELIDQLAIEDGTDRDTETVPQTRLAATQQLESVMKGQRRFFWQSPLFWIGSIVAFLFGISGGVLMAYRNPPQDLLANSRQISDVIPKLDSAKDQFRYARWQRTEKAWLAVREYFESEITDDPEDQTDFYIRQADENLGRYYLDEYQLEKAEQVYMRLSSLDKLRKRQITIGHAGLAIVYDQMNNETAVREMLFLIDGELDQLDSRMRGEIEWIMLRYSPGGPTTQSAIDRP